MLGLLAALGLAALAPASALAASPTPTTNPQLGTVVVTVADEETHDPLGGATVHLSGFVDSAADPVFSADETAGADGTATFANVPEQSAGHAVRVSADASLTQTTTTDGCTVTRTWQGGSDAAAVTADTALQVDAARTDDVACAPPGPDAPLLSGIVVGPDGRPFEVQFATVTMDRQDGGHWESSVTVASDGRFSIRIEPWGTPDAPAHLLLRITGAVTGSETEDGCTYDLAPQATLERSVELARGGSLPEIGLVAELTRVSAVCGSTGTPAPSRSPRPSATPRPSTGGAGATPPPTLPPTDSLGGDRAGRTIDAALVGMFIGLGGVLGWAVLRKGPRRP